MSALIRALTYVTVLVGLVLVFLPAQVLSETGISRPTELSAPQIGGIVGAAMGAALVVWCVLAFAFIGRGTPLPFDPPLRLVIRGPYRVVRNPTRWLSARVPRLAPRRSSTNLFSFSVSP
jgi:protein-S-isoprenylcysteine O-methyltransferase Ste14